MKKSVFLLSVAALLTLAGCNTTGSSSYAGTEASLDDLKNAIKSIGNNFTLKTIDYEDEEGKTVVGENYYGKFMPSGQIDGYMKVLEDDETIHYYSYSPDAASEDWDGFYDDGRADYSAEDFARMKELDHLLNLDTFTATGNLTFHTDDELSVLRLLDLTNHPLAYYFGHAHDGMDVILTEELELKQINFLGFNAPMLGMLVPPEDNIFYSVFVEDIGTSKIDFIEEYANGDVEAKTPELYMLLRMGEDGKPLYDGYEFEFTGILSSILDMGASCTIISNMAPALFLDATPFNPWENYSKELVVKGTVSSQDGAVVFTDGELLEVVEEVDDFYRYNIGDADTWTDEFANAFNGPMMNGMSVDMTLTYVEGTVTTQGESSLKCQFNSSTPVEVKFSEGLDEEKKQEFVDFFEGDDIQSGDSLDFTNLTFRWEDGPVVYMGETSRFARSITFGSFCMNHLGMELPEPPTCDGWNIMFEDYYEIDEETTVAGIFAIAFITEEDLEAFADAYGALFEEAGFTLLEKDTDADGDIYCAYQKDSVVVLFSPYKFSYDDGSYELRVVIEAYNSEYVL